MDSVWSVARVTIEVVAGLYVLIKVAERVTAHVGVMGRVARYVSSVFDKYALFIRLGTRLCMPYVVAEFKQNPNNPSAQLTPYFSLPYVALLKFGGWLSPKAKMVVYADLMGLRPYSGPIATRAEVTESLVSDRTGVYRIESVLQHHDWVARYNNHCQTYRNMLQRYVDIAKRLTP